MERSCRIHELLEHITSYTEQIDPALRSVLQPGYSPTEIGAIIPFEPPDEVVELYRWHNGISDPDEIEAHRLFYYHHFLSLEDGYRIYRELMAANQTFEPNTYNPNLFPIFSFMGEYYMVQTNPAAEDHGSIWFVYHSEAQVYDSLTTMLEAIHECYEVGAYRIEQGEIVPDEPRVAAIKAKWNRCRRQDDGTTYDYHP